MMKTILTTTMLASTLSVMSPAMAQDRDLRFDLTIEDDRSVQRIFVKYPAEDEFLFVEQIFTPAQ